MVHDRGLRLAKSVEAVSLMQASNANAYFFCSAEIINESYRASAIDHQKYCLAR